MGKITLWQKFILFFFISFLVFIGSVFGFAYFLGAPPITFDEKMVLFDQHNEPIPYHAAETNVTPLEDISPYFLQAIVLVEDKQFYDHHGFQFNRMFKAAWTNIRAKSLKEGASTITQQLAKNLYLTHEKTWTRKIKEAFYTIRLEMFYSKEEILTSYLHSIYFGHGAYGIHDASQFFFHKKPVALSLAEAATLAAIPKGPSYYSPLNNEKKAAERKQLILQLLQEENIITEEEAQEANTEELTYYAEHDHAQMKANYYIDTVIREAANILRTEKDAILNGGYMIHTTYDPAAQDAAENALDLYMPDDSDLEVASVMMDVPTGAILALIGGKSYKKSSFNRAIDAKRMVGSTFKPFLYYTALEQGFTPTTKLVSEPTVFNTGDKQRYEPRNYHDKYANDAITLTDALALSDNIYAVKTNILVGPDKVTQTAEKFGIYEDLAPVPSLALGISSISVLDMTNAYRIIANGGQRTTGYTIEKITHVNGTNLYERPEIEQTESKTLDEQKLFVLTRLMTGMFDSRLNNYMDVTGASIQHMLTKTYAGKSGTTDTDSWMIGYSPSTALSVWVGYDKNKPLHLHHEKAAVKKIWAHTMEAVHHGKENEDFRVPSNIEEKMTDPQTGELATPFCPTRRKTYFESGTAPTTYCNVHHAPQKEEIQKEEEEETDNFFSKIMEFFSF